MATPPVNFIDETIISVGDFKQASTANNHKEDVTEKEEIIVSIPLALLYALNLVPVGSANTPRD